jgi:hypothetical protein
VPPPGMTGLLPTRGARLQPVGAGR